MHIWRKNYSISRYPKLEAGGCNRIILLDSVYQIEGGEYINYKIRNKVYMDIGWLKDCGRQYRLVPQKTFIIHVGFAFSNYSSCKVKVPPMLLWEKEWWWDAALDHEMFVEANEWLIGEIFFSFLFVLGADPNVFLFLLAFSPSTFFPLPRHAFDVYKWVAIT